MANLKNIPLETERLFLRLPEMGDASDMQRYAGDFDVASMTLSIPHPYDYDMAVEWIQSIHERSEDATQFTYAIIRREDNQLIGACGFDLNGEHRKAEIGYWIGQPYRGNGYATESARRLIQFCFEDLNLNRVEACYFAINPASRRVMEKAGMTYEGTLRQSIIREIPSVDYRACHDLGYCAILRSEWDATQ